MLLKTSRKGEVFGTKRETMNETTHGYDVPSKRGREKETRKVKETPEGKGKEQRERQSFVSIHEKCFAETHLFL